MSPVSDANCGGSASHEYKGGTNCGKDFFKTRFLREGVEDPDFLRTDLSRFFKRFKSYDNFLNRLMP
jgi:hypothetical protein